MSNSIIIKGAREHNLKNLDVEIPRDKLVVMTGLSGSGKSSLAFDTIYAEGQRRYVESLSAYARQFLEQMGKPDVDSIEGLSPAISIEQKSTSHNPRSTVGTVTEIYDSLRLLYARVGHPYCFQCGQEITAQTVQQMVDAGFIRPEDARHHPRKNQLIAAMGMEEALPIHVSEQAQMIQDGDAYLLCTDGWWDHLDESDLESTLDLAQTAQQWLDRMADLVAARQQPNQDNYTAVALWVGNPGETTRIG